MKLETKIKFKIRDKSFEIEKNKLYEKVCGGEKADKI